MTTGWLHTHYYIIIIHKAKQRPKSVGKKKTQKVCENKETDSPFGINRMKLAGTCSLLKESHEKKSKKNGTPIFWEWDSYFLAGTPTFYKKGVPDSHF